MDNESSFKNAIVVSPPSQYLSLKAGGTYSGEINVANPSGSTEEAEYSVSIIPYGVNAGDYTADFDSNAVYNDIIEWVSVDKEQGVLTPNELATIHYMIRVPENAPAGGQYCAIAIQKINKDAPSLVNEVIEIASIIYARIEGEITESGELLQHSLPTVVFTPPIVSHLTFSNTGNVHLNAKVDTKITNLFGDEVIFDSREQENTITETIMPETTRAVNYDFDGMPELGILNFSQTVVYNGQKSELNQTIFVCPIWFIILVLVTIAAIVAVIVRGVRQHKKAKKQ